MEHIECYTSGWTGVFVKNSENGLFFGITTVYVAEMDSVLIRKCLEFETCDLGEFYDFWGDEMTQQYLSGTIYTDVMAVCTDMTERNLYRFYGREELMIKFITYVFLNYIEGLIEGEREGFDEEWAYIQSFYIGDDGSVSDVYDWMIACMKRLIVAKKENLKLRERMIDRMCKFLWFREVVGL